MTAKSERILVFQPLYPAGANFDYRMLGLQHWVTDRLTEIGLEGVSALFTAPGEGPKQLSGSEPPNDAQIRETLVANASRYGLLTSFVSLGGSPHLAIARLVEVRRGHPLRMLARWKFEGDTNHLPTAADQLFVLVGTRLGAAFKPHTWSDMFGTTDPIAASNYLTALGCHLTCDHGMVLADPEAALKAVLSGIAVGMQPAIGLLPHLVASLQASGSAPDGMLAAAVAAGVQMVTIVPAAWRPMMRTLGLGAGSVN